MMKMGSGNKKLILVLILAAFLVMAGCSQTPAPEPEEEMEPPVVETPEPEEEEEELDLEDNESADELNEAEGLYVGFADTHSVEIELIGESQPFMVFQLDEAVRAQLEEEEYDTGTEVSIKYRVLEQGQPVIMEIKAK